MPITDAQARAGLDEFKRRWPQVSPSLDLIRAVLEAAERAAWSTDMEADLARVTRNRDMWRDQCERQAAQIERLRGALENIMFADIPRSLGRRWRTDGEPSDHDECTHGAMMNEDCPACLDAYIKGALGMEGAAEVYPGGV